MVVWCGVVWWRIEVGQAVSSGGIKEYQLN